MNSIESVEEMISRLDKEIDSLRKQELDVMHEIHACEETLAFDKEWLKEIQDEKMILLHTKMACRNFINEGGGLDMLVD